MQDVNRLKLVLVEQKKTSKWLSEELGVSPSTVSKWCTNSSQPEQSLACYISEFPLAFSYSCPTLGRSVCKYNKNNRGYDNS